MQYESAAPSPWKLDNDSDLAARAGDQARALLTARSTDTGLFARELSLVLTELLGGVRFASGEQASDVVLRAGYLVAALSLAGTISVATAAQALSRDPQELLSAMAAHMVSKQINV